VYNAFYPGRIEGDDQTMRTPAGGTAATNSNELVKDFLPSEGQAHAHDEE
jgi:hypothetical protein